MKVVLLKDIANVGRQYELKEVADGFARNFLFSRRLAMMTDSRNLAHLEELKKKAEAEVKQSQTEFATALAKLAATSIRLQLKANESGHLFAGIHQAEIVEAVAAQTGARLAPKLVQLDKPIKELGEHEIKFKSGDWEGSFKLIIEAAE